MKTPQCLLQRRPETMIHLVVFAWARVFSVPLLLLLLGLVATNNAIADEQARVLHADPENYRQLLRQLKPGDTLKLAEGVYRQGLPIHYMQGEPGKPLTIEGPSPPQQAIFVARAGANTVSLLNAAHVVIRRLEIDGRGLPVDGVKAEGHANWTHHIVLEELRIVGHGHDQQTVAISTKCPSWGWVVRRNTIIEPGTGMYFGNSNGAAPFVAALIEDNTVLNPRGYAMQIKHQKPRPQLEGLPTQSSQTVIRGNRFIKSDGASVGILARPSLLIGHMPLEGPGAEDIYLIYRNLFYDNPTEALFQGEGNIALYNNLFVNPHGMGIRIQPHNHRPRTVFVFHNTVVSATKGIEISGMEADHTPMVLTNAVFAAQTLVLPQAETENNFVADYYAAIEELKQPTGAWEELNLRPRAGRLLAEHVILPASAADLPHAAYDFTGARRQRPSFGAYDGHKEE